MGYKVLSENAPSLSKLIEIIIEEGTYYTQYTNNINPEAKSMTLSYYAYPYSTTVTRYHNECTNRSTYEIQISKGNRIANYEIPYLSWTEGGYFQQSLLEEEIPLEWYEISALKNFLDSVHANDSNYTDDKLSFEQFLIDSIIKI